jgi:Raf kinase inhibitor-like YbhB/YbcL family protein
MSRLQTLLLLFISTAALSATPVQSPTFRFWSDDLQRGTFTSEQVYDSFGCTGQNRSPHLAWSGAPKDAESFVITVYDPDAPTGSGFWHWVVANIPARTTMIAGNASRTPRMPNGALETRTDFGAPGWGGPCPPQGDQPHRYVFTIHALDVPKLDVTVDTTAALVGFMTNSHRIASASFTVRYGR